MSATKVAPGLPSTTPATTRPDASIVDAQALRGVIIGLGLSAVLWLLIALVVISVW
jgi:hypothetical protein